ncbi:MAG TPA: DNA polymerase/3'-5' exonuclease PolX [candidate division Zixibacteria bacterium]|nr:DNA polymerase/3'-5' exonuclease PolX [candidate division Zixibacteria bacterium]
MENVEIARVLSRYADLLEIQGEDLFRILAYRKAARTLESLSQPVAQMLAEGKNLDELPGIGKSMAEHIEEIVRTGTLTGFKKLRKKIPASLAELLDIEGLGPKRAKLLYDRLGISSVKELERALDSGKVASLPGFGQKSCEKIRQALRNLGKRPRRFKLLDADQLVRPLVDYLRKGGDVEQLEVAGSYRRRMETVGDIDILAASEKPEAVMGRFRAYPEVDRVVAAGTTRGTVILRSGLQVDLRILARRSYGAALHYFTGSKAHNVAVRKLGVERGLRINEYGVFRVPRGKKADETGVEEGERIGGATEEEVFRAVGLDWVPPELREDRGEIQAAQKHRLPDLIVLGDIRGDLHLHSKWTDGAATILEMVRACRERGYEYCAITDHSRAVRVAGGLSPDDFRRQRDEIERARAKVQGIAVLAGCEVDILPDGSLDLPDALLEQLDVVVAAVHSRMNMTQSEMTRRVLKALAHPAVTILAHPTGRLINEREPFAIDLEQVFHAAKERNVAIELNAQPDRLDLNDLHALRAREIGVKIAVNTDAHSVEQLHFMKYGVDQARRGWLEKRHVLNALARPQLEAWLNQRRRRFDKAAAV